MLAEIDTLRLEATKKLDQSKRGEYGQYLTPTVVAKFMANLFADNNSEHIHLLDAGAGIGSLSMCFLDRVVENWHSLKTVELTTYEINSMLNDYLKSNISHFSSLFAYSKVDFRTSFLKSDFIDDATYKINWRQQEYTHAILNPPYKKIRNASEHRKALSSIGLETVNLYSAFVALSIMLLKDKGEIVAIIPRSFCNGNYYKPFRKIILENTSIKQVHLFESRSQAFKDDDVLQENIIIYLEKGGTQNKVKITKSTNSNFNDLIESEYNFDQIVKNNDKEYFIHIPNEDDNKIENSTKVTYSLSDLGLEVSTGPVVDFRSKEHIFKDPHTGTVPLLYPSHFNCKEIDWPKQGKKPNAIALNDQTLKMLLPSGYYTIVKRFSSKEEKQRIVARVFNPSMIETPYIGLENHLNVFHSKKAGIDQNLAYGLAAYLNSSYVDSYFRSFNGHTQVNATDLKQMKYPNKDALIKLGKWAKQLKTFEQSVIDVGIKNIL